MNGKLLLDTNAVIAIFAGDAEVQVAMRNVVECFLPAIVVGELHYGAQRSSKVAQNVATIQAFCSAATVLPCDEATALEYARIKNALRAKGRPIPENDVWIAAVATQHRLELLSNDVHFDAVNGLTRRSW
jgi:tRNA(fMet)-specific endonuclease VapC